MLAYFIVFLMGVILPFAFAPVDVYTLAFIAPAVVLYFWRKSSPGSAFWQGFLFGLGLFGIGASWVYISIHQFGGASPWISALITFAMIAVLSLFYAVQGYILVRVFGQRNPVAFCLLAFPATWIIAEWGRSLLLNGFPWLYLGYSQADTWLRGFAPYFGVYGVSFAVAVISGCLVLIGVRRNSGREKVWGVSILILTGLMGWLLIKPTWTKPISNAMRVSLVQANVAQSLKWQPEALINIIKTYQTLTQPIWQNGLIIWPEAAMPAFAYQVEPALDSLNQQAAENHSTLLLGVLLGNPTGQYYNGLILLGQDRGSYRKRHLVPFGEYIPLPKAFSFLLHYWNIPMSSFSAGKNKQDNLLVSGYSIAPFICYEIAYPSEVLRYLDNKSVIINISDDSWFGKSMASAQQMEMARMRSIETGRFALLAGNTGVTAIINPAGKVIASLPLHVQAVLTGEFKMMTGKTPLMHWHYYPLIGLTIIALVIAFF